MCLHSYAEITMTHKVWVWRWQMSLVTQRGHDIPWQNDMRAYLTKEINIRWLSSHITSNHSMNWIWTLSLSGKCLSCLLHYGTSAPLRLFEPMTMDPLRYCLTLQITLARNSDDLIPLKCHVLMLMKSSRRQGCIAFNHMFILRMCLKINQTYLFDGVWELHKWIKTKFFKVNNDSWGGCCGFITLITLTYLSLK